MPPTTAPTVSEKYKVFIHCYERPDLCTDGHDFDSSIRYVASSMLELLEGGSAASFDVHPFRLTLKTADECKTLLHFVINFPVPYDGTTVSIETGAVCGDVNGRNLEHLQNITVAHAAAQLQQFAMTFYKYCNQPGTTFMRVYASSVNNRVPMCELAIRPSLFPTDTD